VTSLYEAPKAGELNDLAAELFVLDEPCSKTADNSVSSAHSRRTGRGHDPSEATQ